VGVAYPERIETPVARFERWDAARHTDEFVALCADPEVMRFLGGPMSEAAATDVSQRIEDHWVTFGYGLWAAIDPDSGRCAGFSGACRAAWHPQFSRKTEIGWRLARWSWGRGFATEGGRLALDPAFAELGLGEVLALVHPDNERSQAVVERLEMRRIGRTTDPRLRHPLDLYVLEAGELRLRPAS
jgi:RimJ/RimL family protein N-acetyltransferase